MATKKSDNAKNKENTTITIVDRLLPFAHVLLSDGRLVCFWPIVGLMAWIFYCIEAPKRSEFVIALLHEPLVWCVTAVLVIFVIYMAIWNNYKYRSQQADEFDRITKERNEAQQEAIGNEKIGTSTQNKKSE